MEREESEGSKHRVSAPGRVPFRLAAWSSFTFTSSPRGARTHRAVSTCKQPALYFVRASASIPLHPRQRTPSSRAVSHAASSLPLRAKLGALQCIPPLSFRRAPDGPTSRCGRGCGRGGSVESLHAVTGESPMHACLRAVWVSVSPLLAPCPLGPCAQTCPREPGAWLEFACGAALRNFP